MGFPCWEQLVTTLWEGKLLRMSLWQRKLRMGRDETRADTGKRGTWEPTVNIFLGILSPKKMGYVAREDRLTGKPMIIIAEDPLLWLVPRHHMASC